MKLLHDFFHAVAEIRQREPKRLISLTVLLLVLAGVIGPASGCGSQQAPVSAMTSSSSGPNSTSQSDLFTVPPEQMSHLHIVTVTPVRLDRMLRLTGAVAYNAFQTTPVISQIGGPVSRIVVSPGDHVRSSQPMLYATSPD